MTALVAIEYGDLDETIEIPSAAVGVEGSSIYLYTGEKLTLEDLLYALMLESANDAAAAIAIAIAGNEEEFAALMNDKAAEIGLSDTHFTNPHGLDSSEHFTTALDLAHLAAYALKNETFRKIVSTRKTTIPLNGSEGVRLLINHNKMLRTYNGAIGVKTGYTRRSGRCLVSAAEREGLTLVAVTLNAPNDWNDHKKLLDYGFSSYVSIKLIGAGEYDLMMPVTGGSSEWVRCTNSNEVRVTLPKTHGVISCLIECPHFVYAPVKSSDIAGTLVYTCGGKVISQSDIIAVYPVESAGSRRGLWNWLKSLFGF
jgi:D-alanyl-D-alanine carboxypeptidase